jgi:hypothetical protein
MAIQTKPHITVSLITTYICICIYFFKYQLYVYIHIYIYIIYLSAELVDGGVCFDVMPENRIFTLKYKLQYCGNKMYFTYVISVV